ncbi:MAG: hypothetical protein ACJA1Z_002241 [Patiriisocius sp.]|jgi:hypothetical protein
MFRVSRTNADVSSCFIKFSFLSPLKENPTPLPSKYQEIGILYIQLKITLHFDFNNLIAYKSTLHYKVHLKV